MRLHRTSLVYLRLISVIALVRWLLEGVSDCKHDRLDRQDRLDSRDDRCDSCDRFDN